MSTVQGHNRKTTTGTTDDDPMDMPAAMMMSDPPIILVPGRMEEDDDDHHHHVEGMKANLATIRNDMAAIEHEITTVLEPNITVMEQDISDLWNDFFKTTKDTLSIYKTISNAKHDIAQAEAVLDRLGDPNALQSYRLWSLNRRVRRIILDADTSLETKREKVNEYVDTIKASIREQEELFQKKKDFLKDREGLIKEKNESLLTEKKDQLKKWTLLLKEKRELFGTCQAQLVKKLSSHNKTLPSWCDSGLIYVHESHRIGLANGARFQNIGLVDNGKIRCDVPIRKPCDHLEKSWTMFDKANSRDVPNDNLGKFEWYLRNRHVRRAWREIRFGTASKGIATIKCAFSILLLVASGDSGWVHSTYKAQEEVCSSISVLSKMKEDDTCFQPSKISFKPDSAATLGEDGWDACGILMMIKNGKSWNDYDQNSMLLDHTKCALMAIATAMVASQCIEEKYHQHVAIPFVVGTLDCCSMYVAALNDEGLPFLQVVGYPDGGTARDVDLSPSFMDNRRKFFVALVVLLHNCRGLIMTEQYDELLDERMHSIAYLPPCFTENISTSLASKNHDDNKENGFRSSLFKEYDARDAATCRGMFRNVNPVLDRSMKFMYDGHVTWHHNDSPYYFSAVKGSHRVFLKVYRADDNSRVRWIESEWKYHRMAYEAGVPVPRPFHPEIIRSTSSSGSEYLVIAREYWFAKAPSTVQELAGYANALIDAVIRLHEIGILHGDLKPANIMWEGNDQVALIDFEHAQEITKAENLPSTVCYQAPEVLYGAPCSKVTDTYSVGMTILVILNENWVERGSFEFDVLDDVAMKLLDYDPATRYSLHEAWRDIRRIIDNTDTLLDPENFRYGEPDVSDDDYI